MIIAFLILLFCFLFFYIGSLKYELKYLKRKEDYWNKRYNDLISILRRLE